MEGEIKHNIDKLVEELRYVVKSEKEIEEIIQVLDSIVNVSKTSIGETTEFTIDDVFLVLLQHESKEIIAKTAKAIAEIAKSERGREKCTSTDLVKALIDLLKEDRVDVLIQTSRALGNICYENENGKKFVENKDGLKWILAVLEKSVSLGNKEGASFLRNVAAGLLLNFLVDSPSMHDEAVKQGAVSTIRSVLEVDGQSDGEAAMNALLILGILNDARINFLDEPLTKVLVDILASDSSSELLEMCLELLHGQAEDENSKLLLAKAGVCELLLQLLEKHGPYCTNEETRSILKVACNLIVLVLTGDESMNILYNNAEGPVYKKLVSWLQASDKDLQITAVLAMGNFARSDSHCKTMVSQGVHRNLLDLLRGNGNAADAADIRFQHALLSALRNLVIPLDNKRTILEDGLIEVLYPMLDVPTFPVVFKLLGTLRIVIDGQPEAAISLGTKPDLIRRTVEWCDTEDHPGVQGEANRLIAWLIKNSRNKEIAELMVEHKAAVHLIKMLSAQYVLMRSEAALALNTLAAFALEKLEPVFLSAGLIEVLPKLMEDSETIVRNMISLANSMISLETLKKALKDSEFKGACEKAASRKDVDPGLKEKLDQLLSKLN